MSELGEAERALLAVARDAHDPTDADRARVRAALAARLGAAAGLGVSAALGAATAKAGAAGATGVVATAKAVAAGTTGVGAGGTAAAAVTGGALATKVALAVVLTATIGVGATIKLVRHRAPLPSTTAAETERHGRRTATAAPPALAYPAPAQPPGEASPAVEPVVAPAPAPHASSPSRAATAAPLTQARVAQARAPVIAVKTVATPVAAPAPLPAPDVPSQPAGPRESAAAAPMPNRPTPSSPPSRGQACAPARADLDGPRPEFTVADEARLVHDGVRALREGQPGCALSLLDTHAHFYPQGVLAEERDAERALALAELGRMTDARAVAAAFLRAHPTSPLGARLRQRIPGIDTRP